jgi:arsenate reductase (thioredoxin)
LVASSSGPEPDPEIPAHVVEGLRGDGIDVSRQRPQRVSAQGPEEAAHIVSFGCDLSAIAPAGVPVERWDDCPAVSDGYPTARDFIAAVWGSCCESWPVEARRRRAPRAVGGTLHSVNKTA